MVNFFKYLLKRYQNNVLIWCSGVSGGTNHPWQLILSSSSFSIRDNTVITTKYKPQSMFAPSSTGAYLKLENSGKLVLYDSNRIILWASQLTQGN